MPDQNPYHPLTPPDDPTLFFGRTEAIAFLRQHLVGAHNHHLLLILGRLGIGKTSLLHQTPYIIDERYLPAMISLTPALTSSFRVWLSEVVRTIVHQMEASSASTYRVPEMPLEGSDTDLMQWFKQDFLEIVLTAIRRDRFLLLMFDDFHLHYLAMDAGNFPSDFLDFLAELLKQHERLDFLAAADVKYEPRTFQHPLSGNAGFQYRLLPLTEDEARQLITEPVETQYQYTEEAVQLVWKMGGGYPFLLHSLCRLVYRFREGKTLYMVGAPIVEAIYTAALDEATEVMQPFWVESNANQQVVLLALLEYEKQQKEPPRLEALQNWLSKTGAVLNQTQLAATLRSLEYDHLIRTTQDGQLVFNTQLEADWLRQNGRLALPTRTTFFPPMSRNHWLGLAAVLLVILLIGGMVAFGVFDSGDSTENPPDIPPTNTFAIDLEATRRAETEEPGG